MKVGVLTGGGDCAGLNAVIRSVVWKGIMKYGFEFVGFRDGWRGVLDGDIIELTVDDVKDIMPMGGTILGSSRTNPFKVEKGPERVMEVMKVNHIHALIAIGGDDTLGAASKLHSQGLNVVGVPKTMDNDICQTDFTFGFISVVQAAMEHLDQLRTVAKSHHRIIVYEIFGRYTGWTALYAGWAGVADIILIPEKKYSITDICNLLEKKRSRGQDYALVVVAEGATTLEMDELVFVSTETDSYGHAVLGGIGESLAKEIGRRLDWETRYIKPGHIVRGGTPTAYDRILSSRYGLGAIDCVYRGDYGKMVALKGQDIVTVDLNKCTNRIKKVPVDLYEEVEIFFT